MRVSRMRSSEAVLVNFARPRAVRVKHRIIEFA